jgi:hypothetical protein
MNCLPSTNHTISAREQIEELIHQVKSNYSAACKNRKLMLSGFGGDNQTYKKTLQQIHEHASELCESHLLAGINKTTPIYKLVSTEPFKTFITRSCSEIKDPDHRICNLFIKLHITFCKLELATEAECESLKQKVIGTHAITFLIIDFCFEAEKIFLSKSTSFNRIPVEVFKTIIIDQFYFPKLVKKLE